MASFEPKKLILDLINNGQKFTARDGVTANAINGPIEAVAYLQNLIENDPGRKTDDELSLTSTNPLQNKVVTENLNRIEKLAQTQVMLDLVESEDEVTDRVNAILTQNYDHIKSGDFLIIRVPNKEQYKDFVYILRQESPLAMKMWHLLTVYNTAGSGGTVEGSVEPEPDTIAQRTSAGELKAYNADIGGPASDISGYIPEDEVVTCKLLKQYAVPVPEEIDDTNSYIVGYDGSSVKGFRVVQNAQDDLEGIPTAQVVFNETKKAENKVDDLRIYLSDATIIIPKARDVVNNLIQNTYEQDTVFVCESGDITFVTYSIEPIEDATFIAFNSIDWIMGTIVLEPNKSYYINKNNTYLYFTTHSDALPEINRISKIEDKLGSVAQIVTWEDSD